jgi:NAD-dependent deacetylase
MVTVDTSAYRNIVALTGAGISVASGLRPYRGPGGLWEEVEASGVADVRVMQDRPAVAWRFFEEARAVIQRAEPNPAHLALARLETGLRSDQSFTLITQNIDGLHQRAGSKNVVELHGTLARTRCSIPTCALEPFEDHAREIRECPSCPLCSAPLRPDVVLFGELIPAEAEWRSKKALRDCDLFIAVGTSGTVSPASNFVRSAEYAGARTIFVNLEPLDPPNPAFHETHLGRAEEILPRLLGVGTP